MSEDKKELEQNQAKVETNEIKPGQPTKKRKIVFWSMIATGIGVIVVIALLLIFLLPKEEKYEISLGSSGTSIEVELTGEGSYKKGDSVTIVAEDIDGYRFIGWSYGGNIISTDKEYTFQINEENEGEYTANYAKIYSVSTFDNDNYGSFTVAPTEAIAGETVTVRYEVNSENQDKYQLKRLYYVIAGESDQVTIENNAFTMPEGNVTIYAEFNNLYNINLTTNIDEEVDLTGEGTYIENETVTISAPNIAGYRFRNWTYNGNIVTTQQEYTIANIDSTTSGTYIANYDRLYSISVNSLNGTVLIDGGKTNAIENENIEFTVEPNTDYRLIEVKVNNETLQAQGGKYIFAMPAENVTIDVTYSQLFDISVSSEHGTVSITDNKTQAIANENVSFTITPEENYRIESVSINNGDVEYTQDENTYSFTMPAGDVAIAIVYQENYNVAVADEYQTIITLDTTQEFAGEAVLVNVDYTPEITNSTVEVLSRVYYIEEGSATQHDIEITNGSYQFIMPANNVTIYAKTDIKNRITDFTIAGNSITGYTGPKTNITIPSKYSSIEILNDGVLEFAGKAELDEYMSANKDNSSIIGGGYFYVKYSDSEEFGSELIKDVTTWYSSLTGEEEKIILKFPDNYEVTASELESALAIDEMYMIIIQKDFMRIMLGEILSFDISYKNPNATGTSDEFITHHVDASNYMQVMEDMMYNGYSDLSYFINMAPFKYENIKFGSAIACVGDTDTITSIGEEAFRSNSTLQSINLPASITSIGDSAFSGCSKLATVTIEGDSQLESIGDYAFSYCSALKSIEIPASVTSFGEDAFQSCTILATVTFAEASQLASIGDNAFQYCSQLTGITLPASVTSIGSSAFYGCSNLTEINLPESVTSIGDSAFYNCSNLATVTFAEGSQLASIGDSAFQYCSQLTGITLPASVTSIGDYAFYNCALLDSITIPANVTNLGDYAFQNCTSLATVTIEGDSQLESIGSYAFYNCALLDSITIPASVTNLGDYAFQNCTSLATVTFAEGSQLSSIGYNVFDGCNISYIEYNNGRYLASEDNNYFILARVVDNTVSSFEIMENCQIIGANAFSGCTNLTSITIPASVISLSDYAFQNCTSLATVTFAEGSQLESISDYAFYGCSALQSIEIPASVTSIDYAAFQSCSKLATVTFAEGSQLESIGNSAFSGCSALQSIELPASVTSIGDYAFYNCALLDSITIPANVTNLGDYAFQNCTSLATVTFAEGSQLKSIGNSAFSGCSALQSIEIPASVTSIGDYAFSGCSSLATVTFAEGSQLASIGYSAFSGCSALQSIALPESVTTIKSEAFNGCNALTEITIPKGVTRLPSSLTGTSGNLQRIYYLGTIDDWVKIEFQAESYSYNSVLSDPDIELYIDNQLVTEVVINSSIINPYALSGYQKLTSVTLTQNVREIGAGAFANCDALTSLYYEGQLNNWLSIRFNAAGGSGRGIEGYNPLANDNVILYINNQPVTEVYISRNVPQQVFSGYKALEKVVIAEGVKSIDDYAFSGCSNLTEFTLPSTINSFGRSPITSDKTLHLYYNGSVETWLNITFANPGTGGVNASNPLSNEKAILYIDNKPVTELIINSDIPSYAFNGYLALTKVTLGEGVTSIGYSAFGDCYALAIVINNSASLTITKGGTDNGSVGYYAKEVVNSGATARGKIKIIDNVQYYINETTGDFIALTTTIIKDEITTISLEEGTTEINAYAFASCTNLKSIILPASLGTLGRYAFSGCDNLAEVTINSAKIYQIANAYNISLLLSNADTVRVLTKIVEENDNSYLENTSNFSTSPDGEYTVFTKVQGQQ